MDKEYIRMCRAATELQDNWQPKDGGRYFLTVDLYEPDWGGSLKTREEITEKDLEGRYPKYVEAFDKDIYFIGDQMGVSEGYCDWGTYDPDKVQEHSFWLPCQEDLQKLLLNKKIRGPGELLKKFFDYMVNDEPAVFVPIEDSMTVWWLCFYMETCHSKVWDNEKGVWKVKP